MSQDIDEEESKREYVRMELERYLEGPNLDLAIQRTLDQFAISQRDVREFVFLEEYIEDYETFIPRIVFKWHKRSSLH